MEFITAPLTCGVIFYFVYKIFELVIRRRERLILIDKMTSDSQCINFKMPEMDVRPNLGKFTMLRIGLVFLGLGLGLIIGILIAANISCSGDLRFDSHEIWASIQGASVLIFGSLGMLTSFLIEHRISKNDKKQ